MLRKYWFLALGVTVALAFAIGSDAQVKQQCTNATLHGSYAFRATGERFAAVARFVFDGNGGLTATFFGRTPGNPFGPVEFEGTYSVSPECIVTDTWGPPLSSSHTAVIYEQGKGYFILNSSPDGDPAADTVNSGEAIRQ
jgi:hypothetical protein